MNIVFSFSIAKFVFFFDICKYAFIRMIYSASRNLLIYGSLD